MMRGGGLLSTLQEYKCPCCGGAMAFDSGLQKMKCPYCDSVFEMDALAGMDADLQNDQTDHTDGTDDAQETTGGNTWQEGEADGLRSYICDSCGGEIIGDENTAATVCPFCGNPVVMKGQFKGMLKPDLVIPFKLDKKAARESLLRHMSGKRLLPPIFKDENHIDEIKGVYVPFWLYDTDVSARMSYRATRIRTWSDNEFNYTETQYYDVFRSGSIGFEHVPVDGSTKMPDDLMESLEPFDIREAVPFQTAYLAGYLADKYDVDSEQSAEHANARVRQSTIDAFASTVQGYASVMPGSSDVQLHGSKAVYALYPVWILHTTWNGSKYVFAMNGQTGKFVGDLPVDQSAAVRWTIGLTAAFGAVSYVIALLLNMSGML